MQLPVRDAVARLVERDGSSHVRALAYQTAFVMVSGFIGLVGLAGTLNWEELRATVEEQVTSFAPGPAARLLKEAAQQGASGAGTAALIGLVAAFTSGVLAVAQLQRSANRLGDVGDDGPVLRRYARAAALAATAGTLLVVGGLVIGAGRSIAVGAGFEGAAATAWSFARWPIGLAVAGAGILLMFRMLARGAHSLRDEAMGTGVALALWSLFTALLGVYLTLSTQSSRTYGPLLAVIAVLLWSSLTSLALHLGLSVIAVRRIGPAGRTVLLPESSPVSRALDA